MDRKQMKEKLKLLKLELSRKERKLQKLRKKIQEHNQECLPAASTSSHSAPATPPWKEAVVSSQDSYTTSPGTSVSVFSKENRQFQSGVHSTRIGHSSCVIAGQAEHSSVASTGKVLSSHEKLLPLANEQQEDVTSFKSHYSHPSPNEKMGSLNSSSNSTRVKKLSDYSKKTGVDSSNWNLYTSVTGKKTIVDFSKRKSVATSVRNSTAVSRKKTLVDSSQFKSEAKSIISPTSSVVFNKGSVLKSSKSDLPEVKVQTPRPLPSKYSAIDLSVSVAGVSCIWSPDLVSSEETLVDCTQRNSDVVSAASARNPTSVSSMSDACVSSIWSPDLVSSEETLVNCTQRNSDVASVKIPTFSEKEIVKDSSEKNSDDGYFLDYTELDAIPFSQFELTEDFLSEYSQSNSDASQSRKRKKGTISLVQRKSPRLSSFGFDLHTSSPENQQASHIRKRRSAVYIMARKRRKSKQAPLISSLFQYLIDEAKRDPSLTEFRLPVDISDAVSWTKSNFENQVGGTLFQSSREEQSTTKSPDIQVIRETEIMPDFKSQVTGEQCVLGTMFPQVKAEKGVSGLEQYVQGSVQSPMLTREKCSTEEVYQLQNKVVASSMKAEATAGVANSVQSMSHFYPVRTDQHGIKTCSGRNVESVPADVPSPFLAHDGVVRGTMNIESKNKIISGDSTDFSLEKQTELTIVDSFDTNYPSVLAGQCESVEEKVELNLQNKEWVPHKDSDRYEHVEPAELEEAQDICLVKFVDCVESGSSDAVVDLLAGTVTKGGEETPFIVCVQTCALTLWTIDGSQNWSSEFHWYLKQTSRAEGACRVHTANGHLVVLIWGSEVLPSCASHLWSSTSRLCLTIFDYDWETEHTNRFCLPPPTPISPTKVFCLGVESSDESVLVFATDKAYTVGKKYILDMHSSGVSGQLLMDKSFSRVTDLHTVYGQTDTVVGLTADHKVLIWNHRTGTIMSTVCLPDDLRRFSRMYSCFSSKGYLLFHMSGGAESMEMSFVALNPVTGSGKVIRDYSARSKLDTNWLRASIFQDTVLAVRHEGTVHLWDACYGELVSIGNSSSRIRAAAMLSFSNFCLLVTGQEKGCLHVFSVSDP